MSTSTPPPYFPQNRLSPADAKARRRFIFGVIGCLGLVVLAAIVGMIACLIYWYR
jgi:hypothetical protein